MCTRVVYLGADGVVVTARSMDWMGPVHPDLWAFPRGMKRHGAAGPKSIEWTSKYGSVVTAAFDIASADGMNERGLVANLLYLDESQYVEPGPGDKRRPLAITAWVQYVLDNYASVAEAVDDLRKEPFYVSTMMTADGHPGQRHLSLSDAAGDRRYSVSRRQARDPSRPAIPGDDQLAGLRPAPRSMLLADRGQQRHVPGTSRPADRFVRMSYYVKDVKKPADPVESVATAFSLVRNASVPIGVRPPPGEPNVAETLWRTVADHKNRLYFFESARSPNVFWVNLTDLDLSAAAPVKKLKLAGGEVYAGNAASKFEEAEPFKFLPADVK